MKIQDWLRQNNGNLELLEQQLGIKTTRHEDGRVILNYSQIDSPKNNPIVLECRGLVLDSKNNWNLVARAFTRFFNVVEMPEDFKKFNFNNCIGYHKEDGSLLLVYYWNGVWRINTRGSFGDAEVNYSGMTWKDYALKAIPETFWNYANHKFTYVFELCGQYNKIVRTYDKPQVFLLTVFYGEYELDHFDVQMEAKSLGSQTPKFIAFYNVDDVETYIAKQVEIDKTFEGIVLYDGKMRFKLKSQIYLSLHRMANNGDPCHPKNILPFIISGELDELYSYFPETQKFVEMMQEEIDKAWQEIDNLWYCYHDEPSQKKFAMAVKDSRHSGILFSARKLGVEPKALFYTVDYLIKLF